MLTTWRVLRVCPFWIKIWTPFFVSDRIASPRTSFGGKRKHPTSKERSKPKIKQSIASSKPPPKQRKEENMPLPTSSSAASEDDPVHMAIALGRRNDPRLKFGQLVRLTLLVICVVDTFRTNNQRSNRLHWLSNKSAQFNNHQRTSAFHIMEITIALR